MLDLGEAHLKDIQHEHVYQLSIDDGAASFPPLKTEPAAKTEDWGASLSRRIREQVQQDIERSFSEGDAPHASSRFAVAGLVNLVLLVAAIVAIVLLLRLAF